MNLKQLPYLLLVCFGSIWAQDNPIVTDPVTPEDEIINEDANTQIDSLRKVTIQIVDSITIQQTSSDLPQTVVATQVKDTTVFALEDMANARKHDSLWLQEMYSSERFEEVYGLIKNQDFSPVDYEELPTELLKKRLAELKQTKSTLTEYQTVLKTVTAQ